MMCHHEQTELCDAQTSSSKRCVISLRDSARRRAHGETNAIAAFVQLRKLSARHAAVLARLRLCTTALCAKIDNSKGTCRESNRWYCPKFSRSSATDGLAAASLRVVMRADKIGFLWLNTKLRGCRGTGLATMSWRPRGSYSIG